MIILFIRPDHVTSTPTNGSAVLLSRAYDLYHVTSILHCHWREFWSCDTDIYITYIRFGLILTQYYIKFSRQDHHIIVFHVLFKSWDSHVSAYTPISFFLYSPFKARFTTVLCRLLSGGTYIYTQLHYFFLLHKSANHFHRRPQLNTINFQIKAWGYIHHFRSTHLTLGVPLDNIVKPFKI